MVSVCGIHQGSEMFNWRASLQWLSGIIRAGFGDLHMSFITSSSSSTSFFSPRIHGSSILSGIICKGHLHLCDYTSKSQGDFQPRRNPTAALSVNVNQRETCLRQDSSCFILGLANPDDYLIVSLIA